MAVTTVVNIHFVENVKKSEKRNGAEIHIVKIHDCNKFFVVVWSHFKVGYDKQ